MCYIYDKSIVERTRMSCLVRNILQYNITVYNKVKLFMYSYLEIIIYYPVDTPTLCLYTKYNKIFLNVNAAQTLDVRCLLIPDKGKYISYLYFSEHY